MQPSSQMLKGILEGAILQIIQQGDIYGYGLHEKLGALGFGDIPEGTIYPLLLKLQKINQLWAFGEHLKADRIENTIT